MTPPPAFGLARALRTARVQHRLPKRQAPRRHAPGIERQRHAAVAHGDAATGLFVADLADVPGGIGPEGGRGIKPGLNSILGYKFIWIYASNHYREALEMTLYI